MASICQNCGRGPKSSNSRSKSNIATKRTQRINLQKLMIGGVKERVCTRCIRTMNKLKK